MIRKLLPSMFYRRLLLLASVAVVLTMVMALQLTRLTVVQGREWRQQAEGALQQTRLIPTIRGRILDRQGRVLAEDRPGYDVAVRYDVLTGDWAFRQAYEEARLANIARWNELSLHARERLADELLPAYKHQVEQLWQTLADLSGESLEEIAARRTAIVTWVSRMAVHMHANWRRQRELLLGEAVPLEAVAGDIREQRMAHTIISDVDMHVLALVENFIVEAENEPALAVWRQVTVEPSKRRVYPQQTMSVTIDRGTFPGPLRSDSPMTIEVEGVATHILGSMRQIWREDVEGPEGRPFRRRTERGEQVVDLGGYLPGDTTGRWGVERAQESRLRGLRGQRIIQLDTEDEERIEPVPGRDVWLTIDIELQAHITALMDPRLGLMARQPWHEKELVGPVGEPLAGAAVVMDIASGEVLAAVSVPTFPAELLRTDPDAIWQDHYNRPGINRPVAMPYEPGSTIKAMVLAAAITDGMHGSHENIPCTGFLNPPGNPNRFQCWIHKQYRRTHGDDMPGDRAISESCNIFFYTLGRRFGGRRLVHWYHRFGLGELTHGGLPDERRGDLPDLSGPTGPRDPGFTDADAVFMAIGQGPVRWTPMQAVQAYATLARYGRVVRPTFILHGEQPVEVNAPQDLRLNARAVQLTLKGLHDAVTTPAGTGYRINYGDSVEKTFNIDGVKLYGKSGTAEAAPLREPIDDTGDGFPNRWGEVLKHGDHAWMIVLVQREGSTQPDYVVGVVVEYAGSGGRVAGPIVNQILHAMRAGGHL